MGEQQSDDDILTLKQLSRLLKVSPDLILYWAGRTLRLPSVERGKLPSVQRGNQLLFRRADVYRWFAEAAELADRLDKVAAELRALDRRRMERRPGERFAPIPNMITPGNRDGYVYAVQENRLAVAARDCFVVSETHVVEDFEATGLQLRRLTKTQEDLFLFVIQTQALFDALLVVWGIEASESGPVLASLVERDHMRACATHDGDRIIAQLCFDGGAGAATELVN